MFVTLKPIPIEDVMSIISALTSSFAMLISLFVASISSKTSKIQTIKTEHNAPSTSTLDNPKVLCVPPIFANLLLFAAQIAKT